MAIKLHILFILILNCSCLIDIDQETKIEFISFEIKNNSENRNHFYVVGPKPDGSQFSYGFPMMPNAKRLENWSVGTKVYQANSLGFKNLLVTITKDNENQIVNLFN